MARDKNQIDIIVDLVLELARAFPEDGYPSGHIYARVMSVIDLEDFTLLLNRLQQLKLLRISNHLIFPGEKLRVIPLDIREQIPAPDSSTFVNPFEAQPTEEV